MTTAQRPRSESWDTWHDPARVRADLRAGLADRLVADFDAAGYTLGGSWLALDPAERAELLAAGGSRFRGQVVSALCWPDLSADAALPGFDELVAEGELEPRHLQRALERLLQATGGPAAMPARARQYLAAALPRGSRRPEIFAVAARVLLALGDRGTAITAVTEGLRHGAGAERVRDDMGLVDLWSDVRYAALFADLDPPLFTDPEVAVRYPELVRRIAFELDEQSPLPSGADRLTGVAVAKVEIWGKSDRVLRWLVGLPRLAELDLRGGAPLAPALLTELVTAPALSRFRYRTSGIDPEVTPARTAALRAELTSGELDRAQRELRTALLFEVEDQLAGPSVPELVAATESGIPKIRLAALRLLAALPADEPPALRSGDRVLLAGRTGLDRTVLRERLAAIGVRISRAPAADVRVAVLGERSGGIAASCHDAGIPLVPANVFGALLDAAEAAVPAPTVPGPVPERAAPSVALLDSTDEAEVRQGVQQLRGGILPPGALERLVLLVRNPGFAAATRTAARKLVAQHGSARLQEAADRHLARARLFTVERYPRFPMADLARDVGDELDHDLLQLLLQLHRRELFLKLAGPRWTTDTVPAHLFRAPQVRRIELDDTRVDTLPDLSAMTDLNTVYLRGNRFAEFPRVLLGLPRLTDLILAAGGEDPVRLTALPADLGRLTAMMHLKLNGHHLPVLPDTLLELPRLISLTVRDGRLDRLPEWMPELAGRCVVDLTGTEVLDPDSVRVVRDRLAPDHRLRGFDELHDPRPMER